MVRHILVVMILTAHFAFVVSEAGSVNELEESRASKRNVQHKSKVIESNGNQLSSMKKDSSIELNDQPSSKEKFKIKLKKKQKKFLKEFLAAGFLVKAAILPLALGFVKLLTGKALLVTMMAFGLVTVLTFSSAGEHKTSSTEVINLVGPHGSSRSLRSIPEHILYRRSFEKY